MTTLRNVKARDIMRKNVVAFTPSTSIRSAIRSFEELHISAAPVIDEYGNMLGMLSASDVVKEEHLQGDVIQERDDGDRTRVLDVDDFFDVETSADSRAASRADTPVVEWMSRGALTVAPQTGLQTICNLMVREHVHRVPVVEDGRVVGIISTMDIVRCVAEGIRTPGPLQDSASKQESPGRVVRAVAKAARPSPTNGKRAASGSTSKRR